MISISNHLAVREGHGAGLVGISVGVGRRPAGVGHAGAQAHVAVGEGHGAGVGIGAGGKLVGRIVGVNPQRLWDRLGVELRYS